MNRWFCAIQKINIWNKVVKGLIPILLCVTAVATLPEQNGSAWFVEKTIEKEEKEDNKTEQVDLTEELTYDTNLKKSKIKKRVIKLFVEVSEIVPEPAFIFLSHSITIKILIPPALSSISCPFYIRCHQLVFYEG